MADISEKHIEHRQDIPGPQRKEKQQDHDQREEKGGDPQGNPEYSQDHHIGCQGIEKIYKSGTDSGERKYLSGKPYLEKKGLIVCQRSHGGVGGCGKKVPDEKACKIIYRIIFNGFPERNTAAFSAGSNCFRRVK